MGQNTTRLITLDVETSMRCTRENFSSATPWDKSNIILCASMAITGMAPPDVDQDGRIYQMLTWPFKPRNEIITELNSVLYEAERTAYLVGHNIKFDMIYLQKDFPEIYKMLRGLPVWDTSIAEYMITSQLYTFPSLANTLATCFPEDLTLRKDRTLEALLDAGKTTEDIPLTTLAVYCEKDVLCTQELALEQMRTVLSIPENGWRSGKRLFNLIVMHSTLGAFVYSEMETNGMRFDMTRAAEAIKDTAVRMNVLLGGMNSHISTTVHITTGDDEFVARLRAFPSILADTIGSHAFWSAYLFGGDYTFTWKEQNGVYKTGTKKGMPRFSHKERLVHFNPPMGATPKDVGTERTKLGHYSVDESVLTSIQKYLETRKCVLTASEVNTHSVINALIEHRHLSKLMTTYFQSLPKLCFDGCLHPSVNQTATATGRTSQSKPNLQNVATNTTVKSCFVPHGTNNAFIEADWRQLEMVVFAYIYRDPQLLEDLRNGVSIHDWIATRVFGTGYTEEQRRTVKGIVFGKIYGGGVTRLSEQSGLPTSTVQKVLDFFDKRYPEIRNERRRLAEYITESAKNGNTITHEGNFYFTLPSLTGRTYPIQLERKVTPTGIEMVPFFTQMCNYPIQGLATADIVPMMLLHLWQWIRNEDLHPLTIVNQVHDSILLECPASTVEHYAREVQSILERGPQVFKEMFEREFDIPLPVKVKYSTETWAGPWKEVTPF